jgi:hypothetical protein
MGLDRQYNERVEAVLARSRLVEGFVAFSSLATAVLVAALPLAVELRAAGLAWIGAGAIAALRRARAAGALRVEADGSVEVGGVAGTLRDGSFVAPWLVVVRWRPAGAWIDRTLLVAPDMLGAEDFRALRVLLWWCQPAPFRRQSGTDSGSPARKAP